MYKETKPMPIQSRFMHHAFLALGLALAVWLASACTAIVPAAVELPAAGARHTVRNTGPAANAAGPAIGSHSQPSPAPRFGRGVACGL
jgi:hypothetical protein